MTPEFWLGLAGLGVTIAIASAGALVAHSRRDDTRYSELKNDITDAKGRIERIEEDIGTHDSGMRGQVHKVANMLGQVRAVTFFIAKKLNVEVMKDLDDEK